MLGRTKHIPSIPTKPFTKVKNIKLITVYFVCKTLVFLLLPNYASAEYKNLSKSKDFDSGVTTEDIIKRAQQQYGGRVISLANSSENNPAELFRLTLLNTRAEIIVIYVNKSTGEFVSADSLHNKQ